VAKSTTGKWVSRVGSSGGGKAYQRRRPSNYYGILLVIVALGIVSTVLARYDYQNPGHKPLGPQPRVGTTWYAALNIEACGQSLPYLTPDPNKGGLTIQAKNVVKVAPQSASDSGTAATLAQFALEYPGFIASTSQLAVPTATGTSNPSTTYHNGDTCPSGSPDAGKTGQVVYAYWTTFGQSKPFTTTDPSTIHFKNFMRVTMAFLPKGETPAAPSQETVNAMVAAGAIPTTTTTTNLTPSTLPVTSTTATGSTTTSPSTTTSVPSTTTTSKG
jgi:hypothetical protein